MPVCINSFNPHYNPMNWCVFFVFFRHPRLSIVFKAMSLDETTKKVSVDTAKKTKD